MVGITEILSYEAQLREKVSDIRGYETITIKGLLQSSSQSRVGPTRLSTFRTISKIINRDFLGRIQGNARLCRARHRNSRMYIYLWSEVPIRPPCVREAQGHKH
jgi:hypothetical protein